MLPHLSNDTRPVFAYLLETHPDKHDVLYAAIMYKLHTDYFEHNLENKLNTLMAKFVTYVT